jgi:hypothetical protein
MVHVGRRSFGQINPKAFYTPKTLQPSNSGTEELRIGTNIIGHRVPKGSGPCSRTLEDFSINRAQVKNVEHYQSIYSRKQQTTLFTIYSLHPDKKEEQEG